MKVLTLEAVLVLLVRAGLRIYGLGFRLFISLNYRLESNKEEEG